MYRVQLSDEQRQELQRRSHAPGVMPRTRDRLEMVRLSAAGWSVPRIAIHLGICEKRVRHWLKVYLAHGFDALPDRPHLGKASAFTPALQAAVQAELAHGERSWTARQLADWMDEQKGIRFSTSHFRRLLGRAGLVYKRTSRSLQHKQQPAQVLAKRRDLETLAKGGRQA